MQRVIGRAAFSQLPRTKRGLGRLKDEVTSGTSILVTTGKGVVFRIVSLVLLRIDRSDGRVLLQIGRWSEGCLSSTCQLPGMKQMQNELATESMERFFSTKLPCYHDKVDILDVVFETTEKMSRAYGVPTRYLRTICTGRLQDDQEVERQVCRVARPSVARPSVRRAQTFDCSHLENLLLQEVFIVWDDNQVANLYSWLFPQDSDFLSGEGAKVLDEWLSRLDIPEPSLNTESLREESIESHAEASLNCPSAGIDFFGSANDIRHDTA